MNLLNKKNTKMIKKFSSRETTNHISACLYSFLKLMAKTVGFDTSMAHQSKKCVSPENGTDSVMKEMI